MKTTAPYGSWQSELSAYHIAKGSPRLSEPRLDRKRVYWLEARPAEKGRVVVVMQTPDGKTQEVLPPPWSARSRVHEYGGGAYVVDGSHLYFVNASCQQVYHLNTATGAISELTNTPNCRYGGLVFDFHRQRLLAVCETHEPDQPVKNSLVAIAIEGGLNTPETLTEGADFYAQPALSPDSHQLAFISWNHPNMPWDASQLWVSEFQADGALGPLHALTEGDTSVFQPCWLDNDHLLWADDISDWWNLYLWDKHGGKTRPLMTIEAEFATPLWTLNMTSFGVLNANTVFATYTQNNQWRAVLLHEEPGNRWQPIPIASDLITLQDVFCDQGEAVLMGAAATLEASIWRWHKDHFTPVRQSTPALPAQDISPGTPFEFPTADGASAYANYYPPTNSHTQAPDDTVPPAIFIGHGGPTGQADLGYNNKVQFWTQRGFAVVDVNYRGSTGFGRRYREQLKGEWGVADVADMCHAAKYVVAQGWAAPDKLAIRGSSAGGYTVLAALTDSDTFTAGVSLYGIGDLETLATDTHKFEARYLDSLIGPYSAAKATYVARSPIHKAAHITCPLLVFQGLEDKVVPPNQAEAMVKAVEAQGLKVQYVTYPDEAHGFRQADTIIHQLETELAFYRDAFKIP